MVSSKKYANVDATTLLKADHRVVEALFEKFEKARGNEQKRKLAQQVCMELIIHTMLEEELFYPACRGKIEDDMLDEAYVEHDGAKVMVAELMASTPDDEFYDAKMTVLSEEIKHHVREEEERSKGIFAQAKRAGVDLKALGHRIVERKAELKDHFEKHGLPAPETRTMQAPPLRHSAPLEERAA